MEFELETADATVIHSENHGDRDARLRSMGLTVEQLRSVVQASLGGYASTTAFHPRSAPGTYLYHEGTAALRRAVMPSGDWDHDEDDNQPRTFSTLYGVAIVVQTGDDNTGLINRHEPKARNPKGFATEKKVASNHEQLVLFRMTPRVEDDDAPFLNWVLLIAVEGGMMRSELSLPRSMAGGKPSGWIERIILPDIELEGDDAVVTADDGQMDLGPDIDVAWKQ